MAETTSESALSEEELEYFQKKLLAMRDEIYAESAATVEESRMLCSVLKMVLLVFVRSPASRLKENVWKPVPSLL